MRALLIFSLHFILILSPLANATIAGERKAANAYELCIKIANELIDAGMMNTSPESGCKKTPKIKYTKVTSPKKPDLEIIPRDIRETDKPKEEFYFGGDKNYF